MYRKKPVPQSRRTSPTHRSRPASSVNLGRLADIVGAGTLASSLGISESQLHKVIRGGPDALDYRVHVAHRLDETGMSSAWLDQPDARIKPEFVKTLRKHAGKSSNPAPLRRQNLVKLVRSIPGGQTALCEMLEMTEHGLERVLQGQLPIDDERFSHINPRLMAGGFPDGWLDEAQAVVNPAWIARLHSATSDAAQQDDHLAVVARPLYVATDVDVDAQTSSPPTFSESATVMESLPPTRDLTSTQEPAFASDSGGSDQELSSPGLVGDPAETGPQKRRRRRSAQRDMAAEASDQVQMLAVPDAHRDPLPATQPDAPVISDGRPSKQPRRRKGGSDSPPSTAPETAPQGPSREAGESDDKGTGIPKDGEEADVEAVRSSKSRTGREESMKRAEALDKLLSTARRGAKVTLWRDLLNLSLPYWGNIRRGNTIFRDELAQAITKHLGLPDDWLNQPTFPPSRIADWVMDSSVPLPRDASAVAGCPSAATDHAEMPPAPITATAPLRKTKPTATTKSTKRVPIEEVSPAEIDTTDAASVPAPEPAPAAAKAPQVAEASTAAIQSERQADAPSDSALVTRGVDQSGFHWKPASDPQPRNAPGPLVEALSLVLGHLSVSGQFTDDDALRMMVMLSTRR